LPANLPERVIHADPKVSNFVFNAKGNVVAMIDFDTIQKLSPLYDIGDALRSVCGGGEDKVGNSFNLKDTGVSKRIYVCFRDYLGAREKN